MDDTDGDDYFFSEDDPYLMGACTCDHLPEQHGQCECDVEGYDCKAYWEY